MLSTDERDFLRMWSEGLFVSVGKLRNLITTGFLDCVRGERDPNGLYDGRFGREEITDQEVALISGALGDYESAVDRLCVIWIDEVTRQAQDDGVQRSFEEHIFNATGEIDDWWP